MTELVLNPVPARRDVAVEQLRLAVVGRRWSVLALGLAGTLVAGARGWFWSVSSTTRAGVAVDRTLAAGPAGVPVFLVGFPVLLLLGILWAVTQWNEDHGARDGHYAMPVADIEHDLLRVAAGAAWLVAGIAVTTLVGMAVSLADGTAGALRLVSPLTWTGYVTGPLTVYLLSSAVAILARHPGRWLSGLLLLDLLGLPLCLMLGPCRVSTALQRVALAGLGLNAAVFRPVGDAVFRLMWRLAPPGLGGFGRQPALLGVRTGLGLLSALWLALSLTAVVLAARHRRRA